MAPSSNLNSTLHLPPLTTTITRQGYSWNHHPATLPTGRNVSLAGVLIKSAGILSMAMLVWINYSNRPSSDSLLSFHYFDPTLPRKLNVITTTTKPTTYQQLTPGKRSLLRSDNSDTTATTTTRNNGFQEIVTFVDTRKYKGEGTSETKQSETPTRIPLQQQNPQQMKKKQQQQQQQQTGSMAMEQSANEKLIEEMRETYGRQCQDESVSRHDILQTIRQIYNVTTPTKRSDQIKNIHNQSIITPCKYTFLDLGANVGGSLGKFIDSGMDPCPAKGFDLTPKYNMTEGIMDTVYDHENVLVRFSRYVTRKAGRKPKLSLPRYPEHYCYVGVEGNPVFTERLASVQQRIMDSSHSRRPVKQAHFLTETVAAGRDGPTVLYLDTSSKNKNIGGSSVLLQPKYTREAAKVHSNGEPIEARVNGLTLSTLIQQTILPEKGAHLLINMDIEGGEYAVLQEVHKSGVLCDYAKRGVIVDMLVEKHAPQLEAAKLDMTLWEVFLKDLRECGANIQGGTSASS